MSERVNKADMACNKPRRTPGHAKKSHVVKACFDGKEKLIRFGEQGASTAGKPKAGESERMKTKRASFKARHAKNIAKGPSSPAYWANKVKWAEGGEVKMAAGGSAALALIEQMRRSAAQSPEFDPVQVAMREQRARPARRPAPQAAPRMPEPQAEALPLPPVPPAMRPDENPPPEAPRDPMRFDEGNPHVATAIRMAEKYNLPRDIFLSLVQQESRFDPNARSRRGAIGLGQLMPATARELGVDPLDPEQNLEGSARYLRQMLDRFKDMPLALAAYNAGPGTVRRAGNTIPNIRETQQYVPSILRRAGVSMPEGLADLDQKYAEGGRVGRAVGAVRRAATRRAEKPAETYPRAEVTPSFKVEPEPGQSFESWLDSLYSPEVRGPDNITRHPSLMYRGVSDAELEAAIQNRAFRPLSDPALFIENDPSRYTGGGAYGARNAGAIVQFDVGGLPSVRQSSQRVRDLVEEAVPEIPTERITRIWRWNPERRGHYLMSSDEMNEFLRRNSAGLEDLDQKYAEGGRVGRAVGAVRRAVTRRTPEPEASEQLAPVTERATRPIMPAPQRFFDPSDRAYKPFLRDFEPEPGGRYLEMRRGEAPQDVTGQSVEAARISVGPDGRPSMFVGDPTDIPTGSPSRGSTTTKTNLFKRSAGWDWVNAPEGYADIPTLVSVENRGRHYYALSAEFPRGVDLARYPNAPSEPRLRPTTQGNVYLGEPVGTITVRGKEHPVYDRLTVRQLAPAGAVGAGTALAADESNASLEDLEQKYAEGGRVGRAVGAIRRAVTRRAPEPEEPPMIAMHNTRPERLERMSESGGVAVAPSIAITRADNPIDSFGDVSLLASPQTVDPRSTPVYARDAYTPRYPDVETRKIGGEDREVIRVYNENTGEWRNLPHTPENALRVMRREPWRGGEDFITDNWLLAQIAPQFRNMSELRGARDRLVLPTDTNVETWTKGLDDLRSEWSKVLSELGRPTDWRFADSLQRNLAEAAQRGPGGMDYINRTYYNNAIPEDLLARTRAHLEAGRELPATYFEAKPRRIVPLSEFEGAVVPAQASQDLTDMLRRYGIEDIQYYASPAERAEQVRRFERLMFGAAPVAAGAALAADEAEPEGYAEGGAVSDGDAEYDRRLLSRMKAQTGRVTEPTRAEQMQALRTAGRSAAEGVADVLLPQSPLDFALMAALGPGGRAARLAGSAALASLEPSEAEASRLRRLIRAYHGSPHKFDEFDIRKIGTGEGAQAFGRGLYFAENEDVARAYRTNLSGKGFQFEGRDLSQGDAVDQFTAEVLRARNGDVAEAEKLANFYAYLSDNPAWGAVRDRLRTQGDLIKPPGHMYEVDLNASPREFLNWDLPLSQQSREVQESLQRFGLRADPDAARAYDDALLDALYNDPSRPLPPAPRDPTGEDIYQRALRMSPEEARVALMEAGIPGTRYLDAGSRGVGGTYNYAVFDPEIIDIRRRYAQGGLAQLEQKYAEGGEVSVMPYDADVVDALVKEIEAEYV